MKVFKILFFLLFCPSIILGQNLIPNGSFEDTALRVTPLYGPSHWNAATQEGWNYLTPFNNLSPQHLDYSAPLNIFGYQKAKTGNSYIGILINNYFNGIRSLSREYAQVRLIKALKKDSTYCLQMYISLADSCKVTSRNQLGAYFSMSEISQNTTSWLPLIPQLIISPNSFVVDKINWVKYNLEYKAQGGENYLIMGNFKDTSYLDTIFLGGSSSSLYQYSYYYIDDIWLSHCDSLPDTTIGIVERDLNKQVELYPNPSKDYLNIELQDKSIQVYEIQVLNLIGQKQRIEAIETHQHKRVLEITNLKPGVYLLQIISDKGVLVRKFVKE